MTRSKMMIGKTMESILYVVVSYILTYACWGSLALLGIRATESPVATVLYMLGGLSPTITALLMPILAPKEQRGGYYRRFFNFKLAAKWYLVPIVPAAVMTCLSYTVFYLLSMPVATGLGIKPLYMLLPFFFMMIIGGGLEEFGWRGILVHNLKGINPVLTALGVGIVWGCWHIPLFFINGVTQQGNYFIPFLISAIAFSLVTTALYLKAGSVIPCVIAHAWINAFVELGFWYGTDKTAAYVDSLLKLAVSAAFFMVLIPMKPRRQSA